MAATGIDFYGPDRFVRLAVLPGVQINIDTTEREALMAFIPHPLSGLIIGIIIAVILIAAAGFVLT
jgi:hypothetical protein